MFTPATAQISTFSYQNNLNTACLYFRILTREDRTVGIVRGQRTLLSDDATDLGPQQAEHNPWGAAESLVQHRPLRHSQSITGRYKGPKDWPQSCSYFVADQCDITYTMYIYRDIIVINFSDASWHFFVRKYDLHSISLFLTQAACLREREYWVFPSLVLFYVHWTFIMSENLSQNIVLF